MDVELYYGFCNLEKEWISQMCYPWTQKRTSHWGLMLWSPFFKILILSLSVCFLSEVWQDRGACTELSPGRSSPPWPGLLVTCSLTPTWRRRRLHSLTHPTSTPCLRVCDIKTAKKKHPCEDERERSPEKEKSFFPAFWGKKKKASQFHFHWAPWNMWPVLVSI